MTELFKIKQNKNTCKNCAYIQKHFVGDLTGGEYEGCVYRS